jgi:CrcB protein
MMTNALLVGLGGFLGSILRYLLGGWVLRLKVGWTFPLETLIINVLGCLVFGLLAGLAESRGVLTGPARTFLFIGLLGGFTTFSSFGYETFQLLRVGQGMMAAVSISLQVVLGLAAMWGGHALGAMGRWQ